MRFCLSVQLPGVRCAVINSSVSGHEQRCYPESQSITAPVKVDRNALGLKCRQHNDVWKHAIRLQCYVESLGINMVS